VAKELQNDNWIQAVARLSNVVQLGEFVSIWTWISQTILTKHQKDIVTWNLC
jgi:hypothetical protein